MKNSLWLLLLVLTTLSCAILSDEDEKSTSTPVGTPTAAFEGDFGYYVLFTTEPVGAIPADTLVKITNSTFNGEEYIYFITSDEITFEEVRASQLRYAPDYTPGAPTPTTPFVGAVGYIFMTTEQVGDIPPGTTVAITPLFNGYKWTYRLSTREGISAEADESQFIVAPGVTVGAPTPTSQFLYNSGYVFITKVKIGDIPADTAVAIGSAYFDGFEWTFNITTRDGISAEAPESQLAFAPGITPGAPTPIPQFLDYSGYVLVTQEQIGDIPADTIVAIGSSYFDGFEWILSIVTREGISAEAHESQLTFAPGITPGAPTPTASFQNWLGMGVYWVITKEQIGDIPANTRVRVSTAQFDGYEWIYTIATEGDTSFEEARESQLSVAPGITPGAPTPTVTP